jgi:hypothetical protein
VIGFFGSLILAQIDGPWRVAFFSEKATCQGPCFDACGVVPSTGCIVGGGGLFVKGVGVGFQTVLVECPFLGGGVGPVGFKRCWYTFFLAGPHGLTIGRMDAAKGTA